MNVPNQENPLSPGQDLKRRAGLEEMVAKISLSFAGLKPGELDAAVTSALAEVGSFVGADRSYIFLYDFATQTTSNTHEWCEEGIVPQKDNLQGISLAAFPYLIGRLDEEVVVDIPVVADLPASATPEKESFEAQGIQSLVLMSLRDRSGRTIGFAGFDAVTHERPWYAGDLNLLQLTSDLITSALENEHLWHKLSASEARNRAIIKALPDTLVTFDGQGRILELNVSEADRHLDISQELLEKNIPEFLGPTQTILFKEAIARLEAGDNPSISEFRIQRDGSGLDFEVRITRYSAGEYLALVRDITQRRLAETALRSLALKLGEVEEAQRWELALLLHDGIGQDLSALHYQMQACLEDPNPDHSRFGEMITLLQRAMSKTQDLTFDLSPPLLHELGLGPALCALVRKFDRDYEPQFSFRTAGDCPQPDSALAILLYRITRELLFNSVKHSRADKVDVELECGVEGIVLVVADNGCGFDAPMNPPLTSDSKGGFGLYSIHQRLKPLGGDLVVERELGVKITITLPYAPDENTATTEGQS